MSDDGTAAGITPGTIWRDYTGETHLIILSVEAGTLNVTVQQVAQQPNGKWLAAEESTPYDRPASWLQEHYVLFEPFR